MKNLKNKKGFTIVELVIVIAVIAILAAVLIPTFSGVIERANKSKALQEGRNTYMNYLANLTPAQLEVATGDDADYYIQVGSYYVVITNGQVQSEVATTAPADHDALPTT